MKHTITLLLFATLLFSCNSSDKTKTTEQESTETETTLENTIKETNKNLKPIDSDAALIATALMAAPKASRDIIKIRN